MERRNIVKSLVALFGAAAAPTAMGVLGRPGTPASIGGVRRRTRRRTRRRVYVGMSLYSLPAGCAYAAPYYHCGGIYYEPVQQGTTVVYVVQEIEEGADPYVEVVE